MLKKLWLAVTIAYVALLPQFYLVFKANNRYDLQWTCADHLSILSAIALLALVYSIGYMSLSRITTSHRRLYAGLRIATTFLLFFILLRCVVSILDRSNVLPSGVESLINSGRAKGVYYGLLPLALILWKPGATLRRLTALYYLVSPVVLFVICLPLTYTSYQRDIVSSAALRLEHQPQAHRTGHDIFFILYDTWSYERTFRDGHVREDLPHLKALLEQAHVYHDARSPSKYTRVSIPRLLLQNDPSFATMTDREIVAYLLRDEVHDGATIFSLAGEEYFKAALASEFDLPRLLGHETDLCLLVRHPEAKPSFLQNTRNLLLTQAAGLRRVGIDVERALKATRLTKLEIHVDAKIETERLVEQVITSMDRPLFMFVYYLVPHVPFIWDRDGLKEHITYDPYLEITVPMYEDNLRHMDTMLGELLALLRTTGRYEKALIILTADHSWKEDPDGPLSGDVEVREALKGRWPEEVHDPDPFHPWKHVPLVIRFPGQTMGQDIETTVFTDQLYPVIESTLRGKPADAGSPWR